MGNLIKVPEKTVFVVEKYGKYSKVLQPGYHFIFPSLKIAHQHSIKQNYISLSNIQLKTKDSFPIQLQGTLYYTVKEPVKFSYEAMDPLKYTEIIINSILREQISTLTLREVNKSKEIISKSHIEDINKLCSRWGLNCDEFHLQQIEVDQDYQKISDFEYNANKKKNIELEKLERVYLGHIEEFKTLYKMQNDLNCEEITQKANEIAQKIEVLGKELDGKKAGLAARLLMADAYLFGKYEKPDHETNHYSLNTSTETSKHIENILKGQKEKDSVSLNE